MVNPKKKRLSYITVPTQHIQSLSSSPLHNLLISSSTSPKKQHAVNPPRTTRLFIFFSPTWFLICLFLCALLGTIKIGFHLPYSTLPCSSSSSFSPSSPYSFPTPTSLAPSPPVMGSENDFWRQPDGMGYRPCLKFSKAYRSKTEDGLGRKYLIVVVSGGMNQQRNQIVDAVVIARILGAALVVPVLQVNVVWGDESEFPDIFDVDHFKAVLADDVRVVSSLPSTHIRTRPVVEKRTPLHVTARWIRSRYLRRLTREGVLLLRGLDSLLAKKLSPDLQKLRCKVAFHALRFASPIMEMGNRLAARMRSKGGPYLSLHLRMEKDVWVRTGCLSGLSSGYDKIIREERKNRPELLTGRYKMDFHVRKLAGLCPLTVVEVTRLLKALGAPRNASIFWAGGEPFGGTTALSPIIKEFPNFYSKESIASKDELGPFLNKASMLAAIDYIVAENSDVFLPSHGGNMGRALQGNRAYAGHRKFITPNKRQMISYFMNSTISETEFNRVIKELHEGSLGGPDVKLMDGKMLRDVTAFPAPECMCNKTIKNDSFRFDSNS